MINVQKEVGKARRRKKIGGVVEGINGKNRRFSANGEIGVAFL